MKKLLRNPIFYELSILFLLSLVPFVWLVHGQTVIGHDSGVRLFPDLYYKSMFSTWNTTVNFGMPSLLFQGFIIAQIPEIIFSIIFHSVSVGERFAFTFWFIVMAYSFYFVAYSLFPERKYSILRIIGSLLYIYNFYLLQAWFIAERAKFSLYAALPLVFFIIYKTTKREWSLLFGTACFSLVALFLNGGGVPSVFGGIILTAVTTTIFTAVMFLVKKQTRNFLYTLFVGVCFIIASFIISAYWVFPQLYLFKYSFASTVAAGGGIEGILSWERMVNKYASLINIFRMQGIPDWYDTSSHMYSYYFLSNPYLEIISFIPLFIIFSVLSFYRKFTLKRKLLLLFLVLLCVGTAFTAGSHPPLGKFYELFIRFVPGFVIFRSAFYKFGPAFYFPFIFLFAYCLNLLCNLTITKQKNYIIATALGVLIIVIYSFPFYTKNFFQFNPQFSTRVVVPSYVYGMGEYLHKNPSSGYVLLYPRLDPKWKADSYTWGFWSLDILPRLMSIKGIITDDNGSSPLITALYDAIDSQDTTKALAIAKLLHISVILARNDVMYDRSETMTPIKFSDTALSKQPGIAKVHQEGQWELYILPHSDTDVATAPLALHVGSKTLINPDDLLSTQSAYIEENDINSGFIAESTQSIADSTKQFECVLCKPNELQTTLDAFNPPSSRFLPTSRFYDIVRWRDNLTIQKTRGTLKDRIEADLSYANKHYGELLSVQQDANDKTTQKETFQEYQKLLSDALTILPQFDDEKRYHYGLTLALYTSQQQTLVGQIDDLTLQQSAVSFQQEVLKQLIGRYHLQERNTFTYLITLPEEGTYELQHQGGVSGTENIDGTGVTTRTIHLTSGFHILTYQQAFENTKLPLPITQPVPLTKESQVSIPLILPQRNDEDMYRLSVVFSQGQNPVIRIKDSIGNTKGELKHNQFLNPNEYIYEFYGKDMPENILLEFSSSNSSIDAIGIASLSLQTITPPEIALKKTFPISPSVPHVTSTQLNPTQYRISVQNATEPFTLVIANQFDPGWRIEKDTTRSVFSFLQSVFDKNYYEDFVHGEVNGYQNGWRITKRGTYTMIVDYYPQHLFNIGLIVSILYAGITIFYVISVMIKKYASKNS